MCKKKSKNRVEAGWGPRGTRYIAILASQFLQLILLWKKSERKGNNRSRYNRNNFFGASSSYSLSWGTDNQVQCGTYLASKCSCEQKYMWFEKSISKTFVVGGTVGGVAIASKLAQATARYVYRWRTSNSKHSQPIIICTQY